MSDEKNKLLLAVQAAQRVTRSAQELGGEVRLERQPTVDEEEAEQEEDQATQEAQPPLETEEETA